MKFIKKNQVVIAVIGLMLIAAGYLNFTNNGGQENEKQLLETGVLTDTEQMADIGDAQLVSSIPTNETNLTYENASNEEAITQNQQAEEKEDENIQTSANSSQTTTDEYFTKSRLERDTMYSQMLESYQKILENTNVSESQKQVAQNQIKIINEQKNAIMITENLIKTKGFEDLIIFINDKSINVIIKAKDLKKEQIAQIQNIITRELKADIEDIHISNKE